MNDYRVYRGAVVSQKIRNGITTRQIEGSEKPNIVIFDVSYLAHRARWTTGYLEHEGMPTGVIYGTLNQINRYRRIFPSNSIFVFAWDSLVSKRRSLYPNYKKQRIKERTEEEKAELADFYYQMSIMKQQVFEPIGFKNHIIESGYEADDGIASIVKSYAFDKRFEYIYIVSADSDLYQLLNTNVSMYSPKTESIYSIKSFISEFGIIPDQWIEALAIAGTHNDVKGVHGVGIATAVKYIVNVKVNPKKYNLITDFKASKDYKLNHRLIKLPFDNTILKPTAFDQFEFNRSGFRTVKRQFGFETLNEDEWI